MKLLMIYCTSFGYRTSEKGLETAPDISEERVITDALVGFIHIEAIDQENTQYIETKLVKNLKWAARKNDTRRIVLHSFTHLSESKASPEITAQILDNAFERLQKADYEVSQTPFGYFLDLNIQAPRNPLARLFKSI